MANGRAYGISHLPPFELRIETDKVPRPVRVTVHFTDHCYSVRFDPERHPIDVPTIMDGIRPRVFDPGRYDLSHSLPGSIRGLDRPGAKVRQTASRRNWMHSAIVGLPQAGIDYAIFFDLRRVSDRRSGSGDLRMVVESAYPIAARAPRPNVLGTVNFKLLVGNTFLGRSIDTRR